jgi:hypothetical protein
MIPVSTKTLWAGRLLSALPIVFLVMDGVVKLFNPAPVADSMAHLGYPGNLALFLGLLQLAILALYVIPRTAILGAILQTGYLGGAVASHLRIGDETFALIFPIIVGALLWGGLYLRNERLRALIPLRRAA